MLLAALVWSSLPATSTAQSRPTEYQIKAAFLSKFAGFVEWPAGSFADSTAPVVIAILGRDPFGEAIDSVVKGKTVRGRAFRIERVDKLAAASSAHIVYVSESKRRQLAAILEQTRDLPLLTVSDIQSFARDGGIVAFGAREERVTLTINAGAAKRAGLRVSSRLLKIARIVGETGDK